MFLESVEVFCTRKDKLSFYVNLFNILKFMKQTFVLIHRRLQECIIEIIEEDVITAILKQKGLIVEIDDLSILKTITTTEEINKAIVTLVKNFE